jgi:RHS repeat-associated protein
MPENENPDTTPYSESTLKYIDPSMSDKDLKLIIRESFHTIASGVPIAALDRPEIVKDIDSFKTYLDQNLFIETDDKNWQNRFTNLKTSVLDEISPELFDKYVKNPDARYSGTNTSQPPKNNVASTGDPVNLFDGNFEYSVTDFMISGAGIDFYFTRNYSQFATLNSVLGYKWDHSYNLWLKLTPDFNVLYRSDGALREIRYQRHNLYNYWFAESVDDGIIIQRNGQYIRRTPDGAEFRYSEGLSGTAEILLIDRIEDRFGNYLQFFYVDHLLETVHVNNPARRLFCEYDSMQRIIRISDFTGRNWKYTYDDYGDLVAVTTPSTQTYPGGLTTCYEYSTSFYSAMELQHNLLRIIDASGQVYLENEYGTEKNLLSFNRIIRQQQGSGQIFLEYENISENFFFPYRAHEVPAFQTIETERTGQTVRYLFNRYGNMLFLEEYARIDGMPRLISTYFRYNEDGNLTGTISPEGIVTQYLYGRDYYNKKLLPGEDYSEINDPQLTPGIRQGFNSLLSIVKRGRYYNINSLNLSNGLWSSDIFPDIYDVSDEDVIQKFTYEASFGQLKSISDPRSTKFSNPDAHEDSSYTAGLTLYSYKSWNNVPESVPESITYPSVTAPDGSVTGSSFQKFISHDNRGRLTRSEDAAGLKTELEYFTGLTREGFLRKITFDPSGLNIQYEVDRDDLGRITKMIEPRHFEAGDDRFISEIRINELNQVVETLSTKPFSLSRLFKYNRTGNISEELLEVKDSDNNPAPDLFLKTHYYYDQEFRLVRKKQGTADDSIFRQDKTVFDWANRPFVTISPAGRKTKLVYNERSLPQREIMDYGGINITSRKYYDAEGRIIRLRDVRGGMHRFSYDALGRITKTINPEGNVTFSSYDKLDNKTTERFFEYTGNNRYLLRSRKEFHYDESGRLIKEGINLFDYPAPEVTDPEASFLDAGPGRLLEYRYFYDIGGRLVRIIDHGNREFLKEHDTLGRIIKQTDPYGNETSFGYDGADNITRIDKKEVIRDDSGTVTGSRFFASQLIYDELNRITASIDTAGNTTRIMYDSRGFAERTLNALGDEFRQEHDVFGRLVSATHTLKSQGQEVPLTVTYEYDADDLKIRQTDAAGRLTSFLNNSAGDIVSTIMPDSTADHVRYDLSGMPESYRDRNGLVNTYVRDISGRITEHRRDDSHVDGYIIGGATKTEFLFDSMGRLSQTENDFCKYEYRYNSLGWLTEETFICKPFTGGIVTTPLRIERGYNDNGSLTELKYPAGRQLQYDLDILDRVTAINQISKGSVFTGNINSPDNSPIISVGYEGLQRRSLLRSNNSETRFRYDFGGRMSGIEHLLDNSGILHLQYLYDRTGNVRMKTELAGEYQLTEGFDYDGKNRLVSVSGLDQANIRDLTPIAPPDAPLPNPIPDSQAIINGLISDPASTIRSYRLDHTDNRETSAGQNGQVNYVANRLDQYDEVNGTRYKYDLNGNLIDDGSILYRYDFMNRFTGAYSKSDGSDILSFYHDPFGRKIAESQGSVKRQYVYSSINPVEEYENGMLHQSNVLDGTDSYVQVNTQGKDLFLLTDLVKSTRIILNNSSIEGLYTYDEYGNVSSPIGSQPDSRFLFQGKKWIGQIRKYDYFTRLFDPETGRFQQRDTRGYSDGTNLYAFLGNNPLSSTDPYGTESRTEQKSDTGDGISKGVLGGAGGGMAKVTPPGPTVPLDPRITDTQLRQYRKAAIIDKVLGKTTQTEALRQHPTQRAAKARFQAESMSVYDPRIPGRGMNRWHMGHLFDLQHWVGDINNPKHRAYIEQFEWQRSSGTSATGNTSLGSTNRSLQSQFPGITSTDLLQGERPPTKYGWAAHLDTAGKWFHSSHLRTGLRWGGRGLMVYGLYLDYGEIHERLRVPDPHRRRSPDHRRQGQQPSRAARLPAEERRHRRDRHDQGRARPVAGLAEHRPDLPRPGEDPAVVQAQGPRRERRPRARGARARAPSPRPDLDGGRRDRADRRGREGLQPREPRRLLRGDRLRGPLGAAGRHPAGRGRRR